MRRLMRRLSLLLLLHCSDGASMNVHSIVGYRAHAYYGGVVPGDGLSNERAAEFDAAIRENGPSVLGGSDFPDFLYACGNYSDHHDAGEAAHWPPFQVAAVLYVRQHWPDPSSWTAETKSLVAFIFGISVHYVTDELWEGLAGALGSKRGFTEMLDAFNSGNSGQGTSGVPSGRRRQPGVSMVSVGNDAESLANFGGDFYASWSLDERLEALLNAPAHIPT